MSKLNVLIAPFLDSALSDPLHEIGGGGSAPVCKVSKNGETKLHRGETVYNYGVHDSANLGILTSIFGDKSRIDLSVQAPVDGLYSQNKDSFYASAEVYGGAYEGKTLRQQIAQSPFYVITPESPSLNGSDVYAHYFDQLKSYSDVVSGYLQNRGFKSETVSKFWENLHAEEQRLKGVDCPVIPYEGQDLG